MARVVEKKRLCRERLCHKGPMSLGVSAMANTHTHTDRDGTRRTAHGLVPFTVLYRGSWQGFTHQDTLQSCKTSGRLVLLYCKEPQEHNPSFLHEVGSEHSKEGGGLAVLPLPVVVAPPPRTRRKPYDSSLHCTRVHRPLYYSHRASALSPQPSALIGHRRNSCIVVDVTKYLYRY